MGKPHTRQTVNYRILMTRPLKVYSTLRNAVPAEQTMISASVWSVRLVPIAVMQQNIMMQNSINGEGDEIAGSG